MANTRTVVEILNASLQKIAEIKALYPINKAGMVLRYSRELSDYGQCMFRVSTKDDVLEQFGDILQPHKYHIRIKRGPVTVWQGAIVDNPTRNKNYVEVKAVEYLYYLSKILIRRDADNPATDDDESNFRVFSSGTMASAVQTIFQNAITDLGSSHILSTASVGTIDNPDYPDNFLDSTNHPLTGGWNFSSDVTVQFDYHSALYVLKSFGNYTNADFELTTSLVFNFKKLIGERIKGLTFTYDRVGTNIVDYNFPRLGQRMANDLVGIATDDRGNVLHASKTDTTSLNSIGRLQDARAYTDVKNQNLLDSRMANEIRLTVDPDESPITIVLDEKAYPLGQFNLGDLVWVKVKDHVIDYEKERRIIGWTVNLHNTGREMTYIQTNRPVEDLQGAS